MTLPQKLLTQPINDYNYFIINGNQPQKLLIYLKKRTLPKETAYFKRHQKDKIFHYYKVSGGSGKTKDGYQEVINFLNDTPTIFVEHNQPYDPSNPDKPFDLTGTWCTYGEAFQ